MTRCWTTRLIGIAMLIAAAGRVQAADADGVTFFENKVRPILAEHCFKCHGPDKQKAGLRWDHISFILKGGERGPEIVPGRPEMSRIIEAVGYGNSELQMPPDGPLDKSLIETLRQWITMGAPWPDEPVPGGGSAGATHRGFDLQQRRAEHWAWQPVTNAPVPQVKDTKWASDPIDNFVLAKLEEAGIKPAGDADRRTLIRRVYFDIIGLPPTPEAVEAFVNDPSPDAYEKVVDGLLGSEHYGERWARHWMDCFRYAESRGHEFDYDVPNAWQFRDYLIRALNDDVPYRQFVMESIAGDLLPEPRMSKAGDFNESVLGTGFWWLGEWVHSPVDLQQDEADRFDNMVDVMGKSFLGMTLGCARCHDHKFDAISTKDYYALFGFLQSSRYRQVRFESYDHNLKIARAIQTLDDASRPKLAADIAAACRPAVEHAADYLKAARQALTAQTPAAEIAAGAKMDPALLEAWVSELREARKHGDDAFHAFAVIGPDRDASPERMQTIRQQSVEAQRNSAADLHEQVILDYAKAGADAWITDSVIFGVRPQRPGDLRVDGLSGHALTGVVTQSAAVQGMIWNKIALAPQTEADEGSVRNHEGAQGRSIHSPTFTLNGQRLFYLIRGSVGAYVTIDSHRLNKGPLHASMYQTFDDPVGKLRWVEHNVRDYTGHNAHVEFTPHGDKPFELLRVVLADDRPAVPEGNAVVATMLEDEAITTPDALAVAYGKLLTQALDRFAADKIVGSPDAADMAALANVILTRTDLFPRSATNTAAAEYASRRQTLITQIKTDSHLAPAMFDGSGEDNAVFIRGSYKSPGDTVPRRFLEALGGLDHPAPATGSGRLELAQQIVDDAKDPFVSRVQVNRIWHHLFGRGIVATIDNLGVLGAEPTHPQLLDHLAWRFTHELKWSNKAMVRAIVLSRTYRMDSRPLDEHAEEIDPQNKLLHRTNIRRLEGEAIRDEILAVSGRLNDRAYGPSVDVYLTPFMEGRGRPKSGPLDGDGRRSVYTSIRRNFLPPMMLAFDMPIPYTARPMRTISNVPAQALIMMNDPFVVDQAKLWAKHVCDDKQATPKQRVESMYERAFCRKPDERELAEALDFVGDSSDPAVWADLGHVLMNVKEFIFLH